MSGSFSKMVSPWHLVLSDHVAISLLPPEFAWSSSSTTSFSTKATDDDFRFQLLSHKWFALFCVLNVVFSPFFFSHLRKCNCLSKLLEKSCCLQESNSLQRFNLTRTTQEAVLHCLMERVVDCMKRKWSG